MRQGSHISSNVNTICLKGYFSPFDLNAKHLNRRISLEEDITLMIIVKADHVTDLGKPHVIQIILQDLHVLHYITAIDYTV